MSRPYSEIWRGEGRRKRRPCAPNIRQLYTRVVADFFTTACPSNPPTAATRGRGRQSPAIGHSLAAVRRGHDIDATQNIIWTRYG